MTSFPTPSALDALRLLAAVGDAEAGRRPGFSVRCAALAAHFARDRGLSSERVEAAWFAALLAEIGRIRVRIAPGSSERLRRQALWDTPLEGARLVATVAGLPPGTADLIRWHRERYDGTGYPDRLRWHGTPPEAAAIGLVADYLGRIEDPAAPIAPEEALFMIVAEAGSGYPVELVEAFRGFALGSPAAPDPAPPVSAPLADAARLVAWALEALDARDDRYAGRAAGRAAIAHAIATELGRDPAAAATLARLSVLGGAGAVPRPDVLDPLSRFGLESQAAEALRAAALVQDAGAYAAFAPALTQSAERWDGTGLPERLAGGAIDPLARIAAVAVVAQRLDALARTGNAPDDGPRRIAAAAGTIFEPESAHAFLAVGVPS